MEAAQIQVSQAAPGATAAALRAADVRAPLACDSVEQIAQHGQCFELSTGEGKSAFVVRKQGPVLWVDGAGRIEGAGQLDIGLDLAKQIAARCGCTEVVFETTRPGLVRKGVQHGFEVAGYIMKAKIK